MKHVLRIYPDGKRTAISRPIVNSFPKGAQTFLFSLFLSLIGWLGGSTGQLYAQCATSTPSVLAKWDFNSTTVQCNGAVSKGDGNLTAPFMLQGKNSYCPNTNNGCGAAILGTKGFGNTFDFKYALCLAGFWRNDGGIYAAAPGWDVNDVTFHPEISGNLYIDYKLPAGKAGSLTGFSLQVLQKQFTGTNVSFEKQGVGVYRNGVLIYSQTQPISASNVNGTTMTFTFPNTPEFTSDGSSEVDFQVTFGLIHRLVKIATGYDNICVIGTCGSGGSPIPTAAISPATCGTAGANSDGKITLSNFGATDHYDISVGGSYTGAQTYATSTTIPAGGVITSTLPNPTTPQLYTVRVFNSAGCTTDLQVTLLPTSCPGNCTAPTATITSTSATCTGNSANNNASIAITGVAGGDKVGLSLGSTYSGPTYAAASALTAGAYTFSSLPNPNGSQIYTVRVYNAGDDCFKDFSVTLNETACGCKKIGIQIVASDQADPDSSPNNNLTTEDDYASYEVCKGTQTIDLKLSKTVSPTTGVTCPTNTDFVWTMVLTNAGSMSATNIQVSENMPDDLLITNTSVTSGTFTISGGWQIPSLAAGASTTLTITTKASKPGTYSNCAWVSGAFPLNDPNSSPLNDYTANEDDDDCASITVTGAKTPEVAKEFSPGSAKTNSPVRLTIKLTNNETTPITLTAPFIDNLPSSPAQMTVASTPNIQSGLPGIIALAGGTSITVPAGTVLVPGLNEVSVDVVAPADGEYCNTIAVGALQTTSCNNVGSAQSCLIVKTDYTTGPIIRKAFVPEVVSAGQSSTLVITIENRNAYNMTVLQDFIDELPTGLTLAGAVTGTCSGASSFTSTNKVGLPAGSVIAPGTCTISVPVQSTLAGSYCNTIIENDLIASVSNGTVVMMTGNEGIAKACLTVSPNPCSSLDLQSISPISTTLAPNSTVSLTATGTGFGSNTLYAWTGTGAFSAQSVSTTYTAPATTGAYTLTLAADNRLTGYGNCSDKLTLNVLVEQPCDLTATATASSQTLCQNQSVTLTAQATPTGSYTYVWAAPAGITLTGTSTATATATLSASGLQTFTVTVSSSPTCSTTATVSVLVNAPTTLPTYQSTTICEGGSVTFSISPPVGASAYWTTPANTTINSGTVALGSVTPSDGGTYTLVYTNENGCTSTTTKVVTVNSKPTLSLAGSGCVSGNQSYTVLLSTNAASLTTNAGQLGVTINGNLITVPVTVTSFAISASSAAGCVATLPITAPACTTACTPPNAGPDQTLCQGTTSTTLVSPGVGEQWSVLQQVNGTSPVISNTGGAYSVSGLTLPGVYKFRLASMNCSAVVTITINTPTTLPTRSPIIVCEGTGMSFGVGTNSGESAYWTTPTNTTISSGIIAIANATTANSGTYTLYFTNGSGCLSTVTQQITINANPMLSLASIGCVSGNQSYTVLMNTDAASFSTNAAGLGVTINSNLITVPIGVTSFLVSATSVSGCVATLPISAPACATTCSIDAIATAGSCSTATNTYSVTAVVTVLHPNGGTLTVNVGEQSQTFSTTIATQNTFIAAFNGLISDGSEHTVGVSLPGCGTVSATYTAPASCSVAPVCSISAVTSTGQCATATNTFSNTVLVTMTNPSAGTLTVTDGVNSLTFAVPALSGTVTSSAIFNGLISDGSGHTVTASLSNCGTVSATYTSPTSCSVAPVCSMSAVASAGLCATATNTYSATAVVVVDNPSTGATVTVSTGTQTQTFSTTASSQNTFTAIFNGLTSDGLSHAVEVSLPGCGTTSATYTAPVACSVTAPVGSLGSLGDFVWKDNNDNGVQDANEPGVAGVTVELFSVVGGVHSTSAISTTVTDATGHYSFGNLSTGDYQVRFSQIPTSCSLTPHQNAGANDAFDSDVDPTTGFSQIVHLDPSGTGLLVNNPTIDAGLQRLIYDPTGYIYCYKDNTILKGGTIHVTGPGSVTIVLDGSNGYYRFITDGTPGSYTLAYSHPNGYSIATSTRPPSATAIDPTALDGSSQDKDIPANGWVQLGSLPNADTTKLQDGTQAYNPYYLVFNVQPGDPYIASNNLPIDCDELLGSIGALVWNDLNKNGRQDPGEPGVDGVTVRLLSETTPGNYTVLSTTITSGGGAYRFPNLRAGNYVVEFDKTTLPSDFVLTTPTASGVPDTEDSDANATTGRSGLIAIQPTDAARRDVLTIDAGIINPDCTPRCLPVSIRRIR